MKKGLKEIPAGVADDYTEMIKAKRKEVGSQPVRHIQQVMVDFIHEVEQDEANRKQKN